MNAAVLHQLAGAPAGNGHGEQARLGVWVQGKAEGPVVVMTHSILSSSAMWDAQAALLAGRGFRVIRIDARGHGASAVPATGFGMDELAADTVAVLDALRIQRAHYVGLSLGGMSGFGLGIHHADRLLSLCLCDCRADTPAGGAAVWDERIAIAETAGSCAPLAEPTLERWFGRDFIAGSPAAVEGLRAAAAATSVGGFSACARAIQGLDYLPRVAAIETVTTLIVGGNDGVLPEALRALQVRMPAATLEEIPAAGHLPNIDQPDAFNAALLRHFEPFIH